jgi:hypothetical protein
MLPSYPLPSPAGFQGLHLPWPRGLVKNPIGSSLGVMLSFREIPSVEQPFVEKQLSASFHEVFFPIAFLYMKQRLFA